jgi:hypothetical protein
VAEKTEENKEGGELHSAEEHDEVQFEKKGDVEEEKKAAEEDNETYLLDKLFAFLEPETISITCAGYFAKVCTNLMNKKSEFLDYLYAESGKNIKNLVKHLESRSIAELVFKAIGFPASFTTDEKYVEERIEVMNKYIVQKYFVPAADPEAQQNAAYVFAEFLNQLNQINGGHEVLNGTLLNKDTLTHLYHALTQQVLFPCRLSYIVVNRKADLCQCTLEQL